MTWKGAEAEARRYIDYETTMCDDPPEQYEQHVRCAVALIRRAQAHAVRRVAERILAPENRQAYVMLGPRFIVGVVADIEEQANRIERGELEP